MGNEQDNNLRKFISDHLTNDYPIVTDVTPVNTMRKYMFMHGKFFKCESNAAHKKVYVCGQDAETCTFGATFTRVRQKGKESWVLSPGCFQSHSCDTKHNNPGIWWKLNKDTQKKGYDKKKVGKLYQFYFPNRALIPLPFT